MRADPTVIQVYDQDNDLSYPAVTVREHDNSVILYVIARVEWGECSAALIERAKRIAEVLTVPRPPKRDQVSGVVQGDTLDR